MVKYRNPKFTASGSILCEVDDPIHGWIPFDCDPKDVSLPIDAFALFQEMRPHAKPYVAPPTTSGEVRAKRNALLAASDWTQMPDAPVDQAAWAAYRQALRDVPQQADFPHDVAWPSKPE